MWIPFNVWASEYDQRKNPLNPQFTEMACIEWHLTTPDEMSRLNTHWFCPRCSRPITDEAHELYGNFLELWAEEAMSARDYFIRTGKIPDKISIPIDTSSMQVREIIWMTFLSLPKD
jgi:hypothetical protein